SISGLQHLFISNKAGEELSFKTSQSGSTVMLGTTSRMLFTVCQEKGGDQSPCLLSHAY
ncbi:hypothetical protein N327_01330, partial [Fulmarus glacialis]